MKLINTIGFFCTTFLFLLLLNVPVEAQWESSDICNEEAGEFKVRSNSIKESDIDKKNASIAAIEKLSICTLDPSLELKIVEEVSIGGQPAGHIVYCPAGMVVARYPSSNQYKITVCCPSNLPVHIGDVPGGCCPGNTVGGNSTNTMCELADGSSVETVDNETTTGMIVNSPDSSPFFIGETLQTCNPLGCLIQDGNTLLNNNSTVANPLTWQEILDQKVGCFQKEFPLNGFLYEDGTSIPASPPDLVCYAQKAVSAETLEIIDQAAGALSCTELNDPTERQRCLECLAKNIEALGNNEPQSFVYSSIGCVDTRQGQFITRLFQIGLGLISGLAVIRIMWGAILRQSSDPAKIQEGWEMILAAGLALIAVVAAIPLLRFLGINLLDIFPGGFLG